MQVLFGHAFILLIFRSMPAAPDMELYVTWYRSMRWKEMLFVLHIWLSIPMHFGWASASSLSSLFVFHGFSPVRVVHYYYLVEVMRQIFVKVDFGDFQFLRIEPKVVRYVTGVATALLGSGGLSIINPFFLHFYSMFLIHFLPIL